MKIALIVNSGAGRGRAGRLAGELESRLHLGGAEVATRHTNGRGHGRTLAQEAARDFDVLVAVGGDGTVNEVARGILDSNASPDMSVAPFGSGNDFAKVLGMPARPEQVAEAVLGSEARRLDVGRLKTRGPGGDDEAVFVNAVGIGFDGLVAERARQSNKVRGVVGYLYVALRTLIEWDYPHVDVVGDEAVTFRGPALLVTAGNGTCSGGGFYLTPLADPGDGRLDLCVIGRPTLPGIARLLAGLLRGKHLGHESVRYHQVRRAAIESETGLFVHVDGEIVTGDARGVTIEIEPAALNVRAPF